MIAGLPFALWTDEEKEHARRRHDREVARRLPLCVPFDPKMPWAPELNLVASTYKNAPGHLFDVKPLRKFIMPHDAKPSQRAESPDGRWFYIERVHPRGLIIPTVQGSKQGTVLFDGDVLIPCLYEASRRHDSHPWMSLTVSEFFSLRPGTRFAKGDVTIAGLGLGHQLLEVHARPQVKHINLVERDQGLVDWILPKLGPLPKVTVHVGDAKDILPTLTGDVCLIDIFPSYGGNAWRGAPLLFNRVWCWGSSAVW